MIQVFNSVIPDNEIDAIRESFVSAGFGSWNPPTAKVGSGHYSGMSFIGENARLIAALNAAIGRPIIPNRMFARVTNEDTEQAYIHSDRNAGAFTAIIYLTDHAEESGTSFYRHRETGLLEMPAEWVDDPIRASEMVTGSHVVWDRTDFVRGIKGRALVFSAPLFHARFPKHGIGKSSTDGRIIFATHFYI